MRVNTAKQRMLAGKPALGAAVGLGSPLAAEMFSLEGFDFVMVDCQHGLWDETSAAAAFHHICLGPAIPMARVRQNDFAAIGQLLDRGALGIVVPLVNSPKDAQAAAYAMRYPPQGGRSMGPAGARMHGADYLERANDEVFLAVQIESIQAVEHAEEIMAVEGVDGCWIGPADLAASMGVDPTTPEGAKAREEAILRVLEACRKTNKISGFAAGLDGRHWIELGCLFVTVASDAAYISSNAPQTLRLHGR
jgi:4-hydroxy-2-oxoheptanedioate aldolase